MLLMHFQFFHVLLHNKQRISSHNSNLKSQTNISKSMRMFPGFKEQTDTDVYNVIDVYVAGILGSHI